MPVYEYRCTNCQKIFEYQQRMADAPRTECEACQGALERLISRSSFSFKGGGWYKDLYASAKPEAGTKADAAKPAEAAASSSDGGSKSSEAGSTAASPTSGGGTSSGSGSSASSTSAA